MYKKREITLERLELLDSGKCYPIEDNISIRSVLYNDSKSNLIGIKRVACWKNSGRITFKEATSESNKSKFVTLKDIRGLSSIKFGPTWSSHWLAIEIELPREWLNNTAEEIHLIWDSGCEASLYSQHGELLQAFNSSNSDDRRDSFIVHHPKNSNFNFVTKNKRNCLFFIEIACNHMFGAGNNGMIQPPNNMLTFNISTCSLRTFNRNAWNLLWDYITLFDVAKHLSKEYSNRSEQALNIANKICNYFNASDLSSIDYCRSLAADFLQQTNCSTQHKITAVGHCHIDTAWLWPYAETKRKCARSWATALRYMKLYDSYKFCASSAQQYAWVKEHNEELFVRIQQAVKDKRFFVVGGTWVEFDGNLPNGESMVRQFLYGQLFFMRYFNTCCTEFFMPDTFGYSAQLPQIMLKCGIKYFVTQKLSWNLVNKFPHSTFYWKGLDGSQVLSHFPPADTYNSNGRLDQVLKSFSNFKDAEKSNNSLMLYGHGDGGGGPTMQMIETLSRMHDLNGAPRVQFNTVNEFFNNVVEECEKDSQQRREKNEADIIPTLPVWEGELYLELHRGTYTTQAFMKDNNRRIELLLRECEIWTTLSAVLNSCTQPTQTATIGSKRKSEEPLSNNVDKRVKVSATTSTNKTTYNDPTRHETISKMWQLLLLNQFHDVLPGTSIKMVYDDAKQHYKQINSTIVPILEGSMESILQANEQLASDIYVFNCNSWERRELLSCPYSTPFSKHNIHQVSHDNQRIYVPIVVPSMSFVGLNSNKQVTAPTSKVDVHNLLNCIHIENSLIKLTLNKETGCISSVIAKKGDNKKELVKPNGANMFNQFLLYDDVPFFWDSWDVMIYHQQTFQPIKFNPADITILEHGPLVAKLQLQWTISPMSKIKQQITVEYDSAVIRFDTTVRWFESRKLLKVQFPTAIRTGRVTYDTQFGHIERTTNKNTTWEQAKFEVCHHQWADISEYNFGMSLLNNSKYGISASDNTLQLTLLKAAKAPDITADMGEHQFTYAVYPHYATFQAAETIRKATALNNPLRTIQYTPLQQNSVVAENNQQHSLFNSNSPLISISEAAIVVDCLKECEWDYMPHDVSYYSSESIESTNLKRFVIRLHDSFGGSCDCKLSFAFNIHSYYEADLLERKIAHLQQACNSNSNSISLSFSAFEVKTIVVLY